MLLNRISNTYPTTTGGNTRGKSTKILSIEISTPSFLDISHAINMPGIMEKITATVAIKADNFKASISSGVKIELSPDYFKSMFGIDSLHFSF